MTHFGASLFCLEGRNVWDAERILIDAERNAEEAYLQSVERD